MSLNPIRGVKFGAGSSACFAVVTPVNNLIRDEPINWNALLIGTISVFVLFGLIGALTARIGSDFGES